MERVAAGRRLQVVTAILLVALFATASLCYRGFGSRRVAADLIGDNAVAGLAAVGLTFVILAGGIDLSVGAVAACAATGVAVLVEHGHWPPLLACAAVLIAGVAFGATQALLIEWFGLPAFLVTLAGMFLARGCAFAISQSPVRIAHELVVQLGEAGVPVGGGARLSATGIAFLVVALLAGAALRWTSAGRHVLAVGGDAASARLMGLPVVATRLLAYAVSGGCAALAGVAGAIYTGAGSPTAALGLELDAIAAVVVGGTLLSGGVGSITGTVLGVLVFGTIRTAMDFDGRLDSAWLRIVVGALLLVFVVVQQGMARGGGRER